MPSKRRSKKGKDPSRVKPRLFRRRWFQILLAASCVILLVAIIALAIILIPHQKAAADMDLADIQKLELPSRIYDRRGVEIGQIKVENRRPVKLDQVPYHLIQALTAAEDSRFFQHSGVDYVGIARAMLRNVRAGKMNQGASTITQQLANQAYDMKKEKSIGRKLTEAFLAARIEKEFTKSQILEHYLNRIYFGSGYFGIEAAARGYFGKSVADLTIPESATICGLIKSPTRLSPKVNPDQSIGERNYVLKRMNIEEMITDAELAEFKKAPLELTDSAEYQNSYVYEIVRQQVIDQIGFESAGGGGFKIYTTIDNDVQKSAEKSLEKNLTAAEKNAEYEHRSYEQYRAAKNLRDPITGKRSEASAKLKPDYLQGALLMIENRTGGIVALVGGRNFGDSQFNRALQSRRPPGTAFKPFVYAAAFSENRFPGSLVKDAPIDNRSVAIGGTTGILGEWGNESKENAYLGDIPAREALVQSKNAATVRLGKEVGLEKVMTLAKKAGIDSPIEDLTKSFLGSSGVRLDEMCKAFTVFPNGGKRPSTLHVISSISDSSGKAIFEAPKAESIEVIDGIASYQVHSCLAESLERGTSGNAATEFGLKDRNAAGKTGTAYNYTDLWYVGYNSEVTCGVWAGFDNPKTVYRGAFSNRTALPIWVDAMNASLPSFASKEIPFPEGAKTVEICQKSGRRATDACYEELPGSEEGARQIVRSTYKEIIRSNIDFRHYCDYHSGGHEVARDPVIPSIAALSPSSVDPLSSSKGASVVTVRSPALLGAADPYNSVQPILKAKAATSKEEIRRATPVSPVSTSLGVLPVKLERPKPLEIPQIE